MSQGQFVLGAFIPGTLSGSAWRLPEAPLDTFKSLEHYQYIARKLEAGRFHALWVLVFILLYKLGDSMATALKCWYKPSCEGLL